MAFCKQCGTDLNGANFCPSCGTAADGQVVAQQSNVVTDPRQRSMNDLENMLQYFGAKKDTFDEYDKVYAEVEDRAARTYAGWIAGAILCAIIGWIGGNPLFFVLAVVCVVVRIPQTKKNKEQLEIVQARLAELEAELTEYYKDYGYCPVGYEYVRPEILQQLYDLIRKGRANNPGDAINIYLADLNQQEMLRLQQEATDAAKLTAKNSKKAARYASASFWLKK